jgi:hypothetical protein
MKEVLVSCYLNNWIINYLLSSFWVLIFCDQIWLFLLLLQKCKWTLKPRFEDFHPEDGGSRFFQTVANHVPDDAVTGLRRHETNLCVNENLFCHVIPSLSTVSSVTHYTEQWQHKFMIWQIRVPSFQKYSWWYQVMTDKQLRIWNSLFCQKQ